MISLLQSVIDYVRPPPIRGAGQLEAFLSGEASYLAQRATYEFTRNTLAYLRQGAFYDPSFIDIFRVCRWESFAAVLADMVVVSEGHLRPAGAAGTPGLADRLGETYAAILASYPTPDHRPAGWAEIEAGLRARLTQARGLAPQAVDRVARVGARRVFEVLPVYSHSRDADFEVVENAIRFGLVGFSDRLRARVIVSEVVADFIARSPVRSHGEPGLRPVVP